MKIGYARTSTVEQVAGFDAQLRILKENGAEKIFQEQLSSVDAQRPQLEAMIEFAREGDQIICCKLDRLARSVSGMVEIAGRLKAKGVSILILDPHLSNATPAEELSFNILASIAQFERQIMLERQREGIARAQKDGKYKGRVPTARNQTAEVLRLKAEGVPVTHIARRLGMDRRSAHRIIAAQKVGH